MKITKFRLFNLFAILLILATKCTSDSYEFTDYTYVPDTLIIVEPQGIRLENTVVEDQVDINVKLPVDGTYRIKIVDISGKMVSQEKITAKEGDNILKIYVKALPVSSYEVQLLDDATNILLGKQIFAMKN
jgi:hypothetical protein